MKYNIRNEYINIENYSPFSHVNEVSECYQKTPFYLPIVVIDNKIVPIHPDTLNDLKIDNSNILFKILVYPTSSFRTVYYKNQNIFIKLSLTRTITRGIRTLPNKDLKRCEMSYEVLKNINIKHFKVLEEIPIYHQDERFNFIIRKIPNKKIEPLFSIIRKQKLSNKKMIFLVKRLIDIWLLLATKGLFLEFHTQNILVDDKLDIYYRDLSDVRSVKYNIVPSYDIAERDLMTLSFDKTFCEQNLNHIFRYYDKLDKKIIIDYIKKKIKYYKLDFPDYSLTFDKYKKERIPIKVEKTKYR